MGHMVMYIATCIIGIAKYLHIYHLRIRWNQEKCITLWAEPDVKCTYICRWWIEVCDVLFVAYVAVWCNLMNTDIVQSMT